jgi:putative tryptophan/tyrosine transport system substrate-binding protein
MGSVVTDRFLYKRREFITLLGGVASSLASPLAARAEQPASPMVGFLHSASARSNTLNVAAFQRGLSEAGFIDGQNTRIEYRWAENQYDRLPELATELVRRQVVVIATAGSTASALAAKAATSAIPIVFSTGEDPVQLGLVASLNRPGGNATGVTLFTTEVVAKRLGLLHELVPGATRVAVLVNPTDATRMESTVRDVRAAARVSGLQIDVFNAGTIGEIDVAYATMVHARADVVFVGPEPFFFSRRVQLAILGARHAIPATYAARAYVEAGGLMSYGTDTEDIYRQLGVYVGRILQGTKPNDLPVLQPTKFELVINLHTARTLGLEIPVTLLARADEVVE